MTADAYQLANAEVDGRCAVLLVLDDRNYRLTDVLGAPAPEHLAEVLARWEHWRPRIAVAAANAPNGATPVRPDRWLAPVAPPKLICIGVNYHDHLQEMGGRHAPDIPYSFLKPVSTGIVGSGAEVGLPSGRKMVDWEAELAIVIGATPGRHTGRDIFDAVAGYTILNDLSARDWIASKSPEVGIDWVLMKAYDGFSPIGPLFTPKEFVPDPQNLGIRCWVNAELKQDSNTSQMVFDIQAILEHLAGIMTLEPGDVIATGTPAGVGFGARPQQFLKPGDVVTVEIDGLGRLETHIVESSQGAQT